MGQNEILRSIKLALFKDKELLTLMGIPIEHQNNLTMFRDKYCVSGPLSSNLVEKDLTSRLVIYWNETDHTNNDYVGIRPITFEVYVQRSSEYNASTNAFDRRQDLIVNHIKRKFNHVRMEGFEMWVDLVGDLTSNSIDYVRSFVRFNMKYIF
jgi:hypothetical protein